MYSTCRPFKPFFCQNELDITCFQNNMAYRGLMNLPRRTASVKALHGKFDFNLDFLQYFINFLRISLLLHTKA